VVFSINIITAFSRTGARETIAISIHSLTSTITPYCNCLIRSLNLLMQLKLLTIIIII